MKVAAIIAAGGRGTRMGAAVPKQLLTIGDVPMLQMSVGAFARHPRIDSLVVVLPAGLAADPPEYLRDPGKPTTVVVGGARRQDSVANGLAAVDDSVDVVLIHDAARPFVDEAIIDRVIDAAAESGAAVCATAARDTVKIAEINPGLISASGSGQEINPGFISATIPRERVFLAQTPQGFRRTVLVEAVRVGQAGVEATDEAALAERAGYRVRLVEGSAANIKITSAEDLRMAQEIAKSESPKVRKSEGQPNDCRTLGLSDSRTDIGAVSVGTGYDLHRLVEGRPLIIGGVTIPFDKGLLGHSDADVLCHAVTDAILGAAGAGDIGRHFPDTDEKWRGASSIDLLRRAACILKDTGYSVANVDAVVVAERPKLAPHLAAIVGNLAEAMQVLPSCVSVKGKTNEGMGEIGRGEAIACHAVALVTRN